MRVDDLPSTWLISFADLLTLVLCTFLLIFSMTWNNKTKALTQKIENPPGTQLATNTHRVEDLSPNIGGLSVKSSTVIQLDRGDFEEGILTEAARKKVNSWLNSISYEGEPVWASLCRGSGLGIEEVIPLTRQLFDVGVAKNGFRIDEGGSDCDPTLSVILRVYG